MNAATSRLQLPWGIVITRAWEPGELPFVRLAFLKDYVQDDNDKVTGYRGRYDGLVHWRVFFKAEVIKQWRSKPSGEQIETARRAFRDIMDQREKAK